MLSKTYILFYNDASLEFMNVRNHMQLFDLTGKTALVTGASSGLGAQFARCLSQAGARVIVASRRLDKLKTLAAELDNALCVEMDVSDKASVQRGFDMIEQQGERIDICVNNVGIFKTTPIFEPDSNNDFERVVQTNVMGTWYVTKAAANHMKNHKIHGSIINISSVNGADHFQTKRAGYCASKAAVIQLTRTLADELSAEKIRINCIIPGLFHTPATDYKLNTPALRKTMEAMIPLGFVPDPSDLDGTILYLASNKASRYMTGACITVDGGISVSSQ
jgi:NAD(P)-dependent dehydrogenase (short-subunit alcohol dehydrogenase family)